MALYNVQNLNKRPEICISCGAQGGITTEFVQGKRDWCALQTAVSSPVGFFVTELAKLFADHACAARLESSATFERPATGIWGKSILVRFTQPLT